MEQQPLLLLHHHHQHHQDEERVISSPLLLSRWILKVTMWVVFLFYIALTFAFPTSVGTAWYDDWVDATDGSLFGSTGSVFLLFGGPIILIALLAVPYLILTQSHHHHHHHPPPSTQTPTYRLRTLPVVVNGFFGVVTAAELIPIIIFLLFIVWAIIFYTISNFTILQDYGDITLAEKRTFMLQMSAYVIGFIALSCFSFLFLPIARGSVLLRLIEVPFEHATKYHVWLGNLIMFLLTIHGLCYNIVWIVRGILLESIVEWKSDGGANFAGVLCYTVGLVMWVTSLPPIRRKYFELFYYTHQLWVVFIILMALHMGSVNFSIAAAGIFLFMLDRGLRFWQSRKPVDIISATTFPCGTIQLVLSKPESLRYNALGFVFIRIRELSRLQWHPFSVSSSPLDGKYHISVLIKVAGEWTDKLRNRILNISEESRVQPFQPISKITAFVEGPHGHESPYHLTYENLILVAGGSGISPFLAILSDILHRIKEGEACLPKKILLVWSVKTSIELSLLYTLDMESICPFFPSKLNLQIQTYVTRQTEAEQPVLLQEEGNSYKETSLSIFPRRDGHSISVLVGSGNKIWSGLYVIIPTIGFIFTLGLLDILYINPFSISYWWYLGLLFLLCMAASAFIWGGLVIGLWHHWGNTTSSRQQQTKPNGISGHNGTESMCRENYATSTTVHYGHRPDFKLIFQWVAEGWGEVDVGVIVCGPSTLEASVATECRSRTIRRRHGHPLFHFNTHSFEL